jgi:hypothetical protein
VFISRDRSRDTPKLCKPLKIGHQTKLILWL